MNIKKSGSLVSYQRDLARIKKPKEPTSLESDKRTVTLSQMAILLYHFYIGMSDPEIYYLDAEESADKLQGRINVEVEIPKDALEKLLFYTTVAHENKTFWHPGKEEYGKFVRSFLTQEEKYDQLSGLIVNNKQVKGRLI